MSPRALTRLLLLQTVLIVLLVWAVVYVGRDEYRLAAGRTEDELPSASQVSQDDDGLPEVRLGVAAQRLVGIELAEPEAAELAPESTLALTVVDPQPLAEWRGRLLAARQAVAQAAAAATASEAERRRVQALFDDDRNASQRSLEQARAQAAADQLQWRGAQQQLGALADAARAAWGPLLADGLSPAEGARPAGADRLGALLAGSEVLLRAVLRADDGTVPPAQLRLQRAGGAAPTTARLLGPVPGLAGGETSGAAAGRHLLYLAPGHGLAVGMRVQARSLGGTAQAKGMTVPSSAVIWHAGQPWIYVRESGADDDEPAASRPAGSASAAARGEAPPVSGSSTAVVPVPAAAASAPALDRFQRRGIPGAQRLGERWFIPGLAEDDPVVVRGAQVLLSEELKYQIKNENDD